MAKRSSDRCLMEPMRQGDKAAFGAIVERYYAALMGVARAYSRNGDDAADAVQNALILAYVHLGQLRDPARPGPWLRRLTINACLQQTRACKPTRTLESIAEKGHDEMTTTDTRLLLDQALSCLSPETRLTVTLYYQREMSLEEIAAFQEVPTTTIKSRLRNARARLRKEMELLLEETITEEKRTVMQKDLTPRLLRRLDMVGEIGFTVFSPEGTRLVTVAWVEVTETKFDSVIACWESATGKPLWSVPHTSWVFSPRFLPDGKQVAVSAGFPGRRGGPTGQLLLLDTETGKVSRTIADVPGSKSIAITADGSRVAFGGQEEYSDYRSSGQRGVAAIYDLQTGKPLLKITPHLNLITALDFSPDGAILATSSHLRDADPEAKDIWLGGDIRLWDTATGELRHKLERPNARGTRHNIAFSPDGRLLAAPNGREGETLLWDTATGTLQHTLPGSGEPVFVLAFFPNGTTLACGCADNAVRLWDVTTGTLKRTMTEFSHCIYALAFAPDDKTLVTADKNGIVQLWGI